MNNPTDFQHNFCIFPQWIIHERFSSERQNTNKTKQKKRKKNWQFPLFFNVSARRQCPFVENEIKVWRNLCFVFRQLRLFEKSIQLRVQMLSTSLIHCFVERFPFETNSILRMHFPSKEKKKSLTLIIRNWRKKTNNAYALRLIITHLCWEFFS